MGNSQSQHIFFVDDEPKIREIVSETLRDAGFEVSCFSRAMDCLERLNSQRCDLLITDVKMPKMSGLELLIEAKRFAPWLPVLIITGYGDIPMSIQATKMGAADFIEKPLAKKALLLAIKSALKRSPPSGPLLGKLLTSTERKVLHLILDGKSNKEIAYLLHRSIRTIEVHRRHIMQKLGVTNLANLVKRAIMMGLVDLQVKWKKRKAT